MLTKDIKFLFDELPKNTVVKVNSIEFVCKLQQTRKTYGTKDI